MAERSPGGAQIARPNARRRDVQMLDGGRQRVKERRRVQRRGPEQQSRWHGLGRGVEEARACGGRLSAIENRGRAGFGVADPDRCGAGVAPHGCCHRLAVVAAVVGDVHVPRSHRTHLRDDRLRLLARGRHYPSKRAPICAPGFKEVGGASGHGAGRLSELERGVGRTDRQHLLGVGDADRLLGVSRRELPEVGDRALRPGSQTGRCRRGHGRASWTSWSR